MPRTLVSACEHQSKIWAQAHLEITRCLSWFWKNWLLAYCPSKRAMIYRTIVPERFGHLRLYWRLIERDQSCMTRTCHHRQEEGGLKSNFVQFQSGHLSFPICVQLVCLATGSRWISLRASVWLATWVMQCVL